MEDIVNMAEFLDTKLPETFSAASAFITNMVRRNEPNLQLLPLIQEVVWVDLTPEEQSIYQSLAQNPLERLISPLSR